MWGSLPPCRCQFEAASGKGTGMPVRGSQHSADTLAGRIICTGFRVEGKGKQAGVMGLGTQLTSRDAHTRASALSLAAAAAAAVRAWAM